MPTSPLQPNNWLNRRQLPSKALLQQIDELQSKGTLTTQDVQPISARLNQLSSTLTSALAFLPGYDQRLCDQARAVNQLAGIERERERERPYSTTSVFSI